MADLWPLLARVGLSRTGGTFDALASLPPDEPIGELPWLPRPAER